MIIVSITTFQGKTSWRNFKLRNSILSASIYPDQNNIGRLELIDSERYYATYGHIDWSCTFTNTYKKRRDTLILNGQPFEMTEGILTDMYFITDSSLVPIKQDERDMRRTETMKTNN